MKIQTVILLFVFYTSLFGQDNKYIPIQKENVEWYVEVEIMDGDGGPSSFHKIRYFVDGDTLINNRTCINLHSESNYGSIHHLGYLLQDSLNQKAYLARIGYIDTIQIYDLGPNKGQPFLDNYFAEKGYSVKIDSVNINGVFRRRVVFDQQIFTGFDNELFCYIEGIGTNAGFEPEEYLGLITSKLTCYQESGESLYPLELHEYGCDLNKIIIAGIDYSVYEYISVHPNPFHDHISVEFNSPIQKKTTVNLYNIIGDLVATEILEENEKNVVELPYLEPGIYFLKFIINDEIITSKSMVKY